MSTWHALVLEYTSIINTVFLILLHVCSGHENYTISCESWNFYSIYIEDLDFWDVT